MTQQVVIDEIRRLRESLAAAEAERDEAKAAWNVVASDIETGRLEARITELEAAASACPVCSRGKEG